MITTVNVDKNFRSIVAGEIEHTTDENDNPKFIAHRKASGDTFPFYALSAAIFWCQLDGILRG